MMRQGNVRSDRLRLLLAIAAVGLFLAGGWWALTVWMPAPPRSVTMVTGPEGSAYAALGERYRRILARSKVDLRLRSTAGALENLALLRQHGSNASVGFAVAGTAKPADSDTLVSLGTLFYEPLWLFRRGTDPWSSLDDLRGSRIAIGPEGSGTRELTLYLLRMVGVDTDAARLLPLTLEASADALARGDVDVVPILTSWDSPLVHRMLGTPEVSLVSFRRADAYVALNPLLGKLVLPAGVADMARNIPREDTVLIATKASLVARRDLHPAVQVLLVEAAEEIHSPVGLFHRSGEFPAAEVIDLPLSESARQFYKSGRPWLQRYLPFHLAIQLQRLLVLIIPLLGIVYPLVRGLPAVYSWTVRRRIFRLYGELKLIELEMKGPQPEGAEAGFLARLDDLEERASRLRVPKIHAWLAYTLRHHIHFVRQLLQERK
jgi:TRAP-type uncharacterized transport system substrate-binding protein